jgi:hypothetical protein
VSATLPLSRTGLAGEAGVGSATVGARVLDTSAELGRTNGAGATEPDLVVRRKGDEAGETELVAGVAEAEAVVARLMVAMRASRGA